VDEDNRTDNFTYDADGRLLNEVQYNSSGTATETIAYTYDQAGNMLTASNTEGGQHVRLFVPVQRSWSGDLGFRTVRSVAVVRL